MRNDLKNDKKGEFESLENQSMEDKLLWFRRYKNEILAYPDRYMADHSRERIKAMSKKAKKQWLKHLEKAKRAYALELKHKRKGSEVITRKGTSRRGAAGAL
ncbi:hypothetical protein ACHAWF_018194 [Thalassiosira exigua]